MNYFDGADCFYCGEEIKENQVRVIDREGISFHIKCYLESIGIHLDIIDSRILEENINELER